MIWYLIFCTSVHSGTVCATPLKVESKAQCAFVARHMVATSQELRAREPRWRCVSIKRDKQGGAS